MILGIANTKMIFVAAKLGIADLLKDGPKSVLTFSCWRLRREVAYARKLNIGTYFLVLVSSSAVLYRRISI